MNHREVSYIGFFKAIATMYNLGKALLGVRVWKKIIDNINMANGFMITLTCNNFNRLINAHHRVSILKISSISKTASFLEK